MADEARHSSDAGSKKRKCVERTAPSPPPPPPRGPTGFTSGATVPSASPPPPPGSGSAPPSGKSFPPVQSARQLLSNPSTSRSDAKRVRDEKGSGFDSTEIDGKHMMSAQSAIPVSYGYGQGTSKKIDIPNGRVGVIIGKAGETIKHLELLSGAKIQVTRDMDADPNSPTRPVELMGTPEQIAKAEQLINYVLAEAKAGGSGIISKSVTGQTGSDQFVMKIPDNMVGLVIGKGGETIKSMQARTGARMQFVPLHPQPGVPATDRDLYIGGTSEQIEASKQLVNEVISEGFARSRGSGFQFIEGSTSMGEQMDVSASAVVDGVAECPREIKIKEPGMSTQLMNFENKFDPCSAISTLIYQKAPFKPPSATESGPDDCTRSGNPTRDALESLLAKLDKADLAFCFSSGMASLATVTRLVSNGEEIVAGDDLHGDSDRLLSYVTSKSGVVVKWVNTSDLNEVESAIGPSTKLVWLESPTNLVQRISDIQKIAEKAHAHSALVLVDNRSLSPVLSQPMELGADIVMHKISGLSDVEAGVLAVKGESLAKEIYLLRDVAGSGPDPLHCWMCSEDIKTMALRIEKKQENAQKIAEFLSSHSRVKKVYYVGLPDNPGHDLHYTQAEGAGCLLSFSTGSVALSEHIVKTTKYFSTNVGFGRVNSLISMPCSMSHTSKPAAVCKARGLAEDLIHISVGIEDVTDLISDLETALRTGPS